MIVMPLKHKGITVGVLKAMSTQPDRFKKQDLELLGMLTEVVAAAMFLSAKYDSDDLFFKATHDGMTGLANRALFMDRLRNTVAQNRRDGRISGVLMIDMDGLKQVNDTLGHRAGDAVLLEFAGRIRNITRDTDTAARIGGDEFSVILTPLDSMEGIDLYIRRFETEIEPQFEFEDNQVQMRASIGCAVIPIDGIEPDQLMHTADQRMYAIKKSRKNS
jgi:diguanylate cyclase (GGDEF)-like protein